MTPAVQSLCLDALTESASELTSTVLGGLPFEALGSCTDFGAGNGAYLGLVAQEEPIQVGILVDGTGCQLLSKALLGMEPADEDLPPSDVSDAMCEIINILAGGLKRRVSEQMRVTMGLPIFVSGHPLPNQQQAVLARSLKIGDVSASVLLLTQKQNAVPNSRTGVTTQTAGKAPAKEQSA
jgi:Chemotaxis phosphatase CheX